LDVIMDARLIHPMPRLSVRLALAALHAIAILAILTILESRKPVPTGSRAHLPAAQITSDPLQRSQPGPIHARRSSLAASLH